MWSRTVDLTEASADLGATETVNQYAAKIIDNLKVTPLDLAVTLMQGHGLIMGTHSIVQGSQTVQQQYNDLEWAVL